MFSIGFKSGDWGGEDSVVIDSLVARVISREAFEEEVRDIFTLPVPSDRLLLYGTVRCPA
jgi:hypothetical protein